MSWDLLGHEWAAALLKEHITQGRLRHAYLLTGPEGVGRRTLALRLAQAINCLKPPAPGEPCRACRACQTIERMQHPDLSVLQGAGSGGVFVVDQVRELLHSLSLAPYEGRYRVVILERFENAHPSASNALLKTLEEPPPQVLMILTAESAESLLPTIVSRCEVIRLRPLSLEQVCQGLQDRWELPPERARLLAHLSAGRPGYALHLEGGPERLEQRQAWLNEHLSLLSASRRERFVYTARLAKEKDKETLRLVLQTWLTFWRDVLLRAAGAATPLVNLDFTEQVERLALETGLEQARAVLAAIERTLTRIDRNVNTQLALEVLMLDLPR